MIDQVEINSTDQLWTYIDPHTYTTNMRLGDGFLKSSDHFKLRILRVDVVIFESKIFPLQCIRPESRMLKVYFLTTKLVMKNHANGFKLFIASASNYVFLYSKW